MNILDRYIMAHIFSLTAVVALALLAIHTFLTFVAEIDETGRGGFGYFQLLQYTLWLAPTGLYVMFPIIAMLGTLMGLGTLASQAELTAMRAAGVSLLRLGSATLAAGMVLGLLCLAFGDWLAPHGQLQAEALKSQSRSGIEAGVGGKPVWLREGDNLFHIRRLVAEDHIEAVEIFTLAEDLTLQKATRVEAGRYRNGRWHFEGVESTAFSGTGTQVSTQAQTEWQGSLSPEVLRLFVLEADALSIAGLIRLMGYLRENRLDSSDYALVLARKIMAPFTVMAMMLFAIPFVLGPLRNTGAGQRLFAGILVGLLFYVVNEVTANLGRLYGWNPVAAAAAPTLAFASFALWRLHRQR